MTLKEIFGNLRGMFNQSEKTPGPVADFAKQGSKLLSPLPENPEALVPKSTPTPSPKSIPSGTNVAESFIQSKTPPGMTTQQAFPALTMDDFMQGIRGADTLRPGLANLLLMQAFYESNLGRTTPNIFGVKPGGESSYFATPSAAVDYQLSPNVLGGGANPSMNILNTQDPITAQTLIDLYSAYNPEADYLDYLISSLGL